VALATTTTTDGENAMNGGRWEYRVEVVRGMQSGPEIWMNKDALIFFPFKENDG